MASIEYITKRIEGKEKEIAKLEKKLERINQAKATDWEVNPYYYHESDIRSTERELKAARAALEDWKAKFKAETEKANSRNVKAILQYLENWKKEVKAFYIERFEKYPEALKQYEEDMKPFKQITYFEERKMKKERFAEWREMDMNRKAIKEAFVMRFGFLAPYIEQVFNQETNRYDKYELNVEKLQKDLDEDANRKYDNIIERTNEITGTITDAAGLYVGSKGELDGYVIGERGTAHVQTIGAGGYNIQRFHFRVLVHEVKVK